MSNYTAKDISGVEVNYYFVCKRKLWFFSHNINMEHTSETVEIGSAVHENSYARKRREIGFDGIKLDFVEVNKGLIHEVKKSKAIEMAHIWQLKYYLYRLKDFGVEFAGKIDYPLIRRTENINLDEDDEKEMKHILKDIEEIKSLPTPPAEKITGICKKCSYYEFCCI